MHPKHLNFNPIKKMFIHLLFTKLSIFSEGDKIQEFRLISLVEF